MVQIRHIDSARTATNDRAQAKKRAILEAAARAFRSHGFHATSMRHIAAELGMTVGNLYYYFENKLALLAYCQHETLDRLVNLVARPLHPDEDAATRLHEILVGHIQCLHDTIPGAIAHLTIDPLPEQDRVRCIERRDQYENALRALIREGVRSGVFREIDEKVAVWTILGALNGTATWFRAEGPRSARMLGEQMADQLLRGILSAGEFKTPSLDDSGLDPSKNSLRPDDVTILVASNRRPK